MKVNSENDKLWSALRGYKHKKSYENVIPVFISIFSSEMSFTSNHILSGEELWRQRTWRDFDSTHRKRKREKERNKCLQGWDMLCKRSFCSRVDQCDSPNSADERDIEKSDGGDVSRWCWRVERDTGGFLRWLVFGTVWHAVTTISL